MAYDSLRTTSHQISFGFLFIKTCPPDNFDTGSLPMMRNIGVVHRDLNDCPVRGYIGWTAEAHGKGLVVDMELFVTAVNKTYRRRS